MKLSNVEIRELIPHRYPFLLVDKVIELEPGKKSIGLKCVSTNEPFFQGHFPQKPIMPGVLILEAMAQNAGLAISVMDEHRGKIGLFAGVDDLKFKNPVIPGDVLKLEAEILLCKMNVVKAKVRATVDDQLAAEAQIKFFMTDPPKND